MTQLSTLRKDSSSNIGSNEIFYRSYHHYDTETLTGQEPLKMAIVLAEVLNFAKVLQFQLLKHNERSGNETFDQIFLNPEALNVLRTIFLNELLSWIEGFDEQDENWANEIIYFMFSCFYINGIFGRGDIGKLCLTTELSKFVQEPEVEEFLPRLVILLRDFTLVIPESFKDYLWKN
ncbi:hypothetical protein RhiirA4_451771 [Rhizophagus irregularis]|uniref:Uncharacterized protein n=1 Tax=Rhizophagus irregularis TaxID=588596 RepID=A0A2I1FWE9_9GLOM|nr:hypothetical protein RhiirA4_451771 [Rhizophagus irregularis]